MTFPLAELGRVVDVKGGKRLPASGSFSAAETAHPYIRGQDIRDGRIRADHQFFIDDDVFQKIWRYTVDAGDVCVTIVGNIGDVGVVPRTLDGANLTENAVKLIPLNASVDRQFLGYALLSPAAQAQMKLLAAGAAQPKLGIYKVKAVQVPVPTLDEQRRIASILSAYDDLIENNTRRIAILEEMARRIYEEWFVHFRFPGHERVKMVESELGPVPEGWKIGTVADIADVYRGRSYKGSELAATGARPFVNLKCIDRDGGYRASGLKHYTGAFKDSQAVRDGDLVMAVTDMTQERRIVARIARVSQLRGEIGVISMDLVRISPQGGVPSAYLYSMFRWSGFADEVKQHANGANVLHLLPSRIQEYRLAIPPAPLMRQFGDVVAETFHLGDVLETQNVNLRTTRDLLLPKLISGELDVSALPEPEAVAA